MLYQLLLCCSRFSCLDKISCVQFEVCASLSDRDYLRKVETEPTKLLVLDSEHKLWLWEPTKKGSTPSILPGFAKHNSMSVFSPRKCYYFILFGSNPLLTWKNSDCCYKYIFKHCMT